MKMSFRWFGKNHDSVTLQQIREIPGVEGVISTLMICLPGKFSMPRISAPKPK